MDLDLAQRRRGSGRFLTFLAALRETVSSAEARSAWLMVMMLGQAMVAEGNDLRWDRTEVVVDTGLRQTGVERVFRMQNRGESHPGDEGVGVVFVHVGIGIDQLRGPGAWGEVRAIFDLRGRGWEQSKAIAVGTDEAGGVAYLLRFVVRIPAGLVLDSRDVTWASSGGWEAWESVLQPMQVER